jgi:hypothetical protein
VCAVTGLVMGCRRVSRLVPPLPAASGFTTRDRPRNDPHKSAGPAGRRETRAASRRLPGLAWLVPAGWLE